MKEIKVAVAGVAGRMGIRISHAVENTDGLILASGFEIEDHPAIGTQVIGIAGLEIPVYDNVSDALKDAEVLIDFTVPEATVANIEACVRAKTPMVIGTTGLTDESKAAIKPAAKEIGIVFAPNMSLGVNLTFKLIELAAKALGDDFDIEIIEAHHKMKKDAPSGTAVKMGEILAEARGVKLGDVACYDRHGNIGERPKGQIGMQTIRAGDIVGDHTVIFAGPGERIEITHRAHSRDTFASGAAKAAKWVMGKEHGLYNMADVLGL